jgi:hypothetical protein
MTEQMPGRKLKRGGFAMVAGNVVGVVHNPMYILLNLESDKQQHTLKLCRSERSLAIRPNDFVWTQARIALWSSKDLGIEDVQLAIHIEYWDGSYKCCGKN